MPRPHASGGEHESRGRFPLPIFIYLNLRLPTQAANFRLGDRDSDDIVPSLSVEGTDFDYDPFSSFIKGALGQIGRFMRIDEVALDKYTSYLSKVKPLAIQSRVLSVKKDFDAKHIASLTEFLGMSPDIFRILVENDGIKAFILRAFGAGDVSAHLMEGMKYLKEKEIPIVVTTQAPSGVASFQVNENGKFLKDNDLAIPAFDMSIESITTKLAWLLAQNLSYEEIKHRMVQDLHGEITIENELI